MIKVIVLLLAEHKIYPNEYPSFVFAGFEVDTIGYANLLTACTRSNEDGALEMLNTIKDAFANNIVAGTPQNRAYFIHFRFVTRIQC